VLVQGCTLPTCIKSSLYAVSFNTQPLSFLRRSVAVVCYSTSCSTASLITLPTFSDSTSVLSTRSLLLPVSLFQTYSSTPSIISGFRHKVDTNCALLVYCAASSGNLLPAFRDNLTVPYPGGQDRVLTQKIAVLFNKLFLTLRRLMSYIYGAPTLDVSRSHTATQHSR